MSAGFAFAEALDVAMHGGAVYVGVDIQPFGNGAVYCGRCRNISDLRAAWHRHDCDCRAHQPVRATDAGGEDGVYAGCGYGQNQEDCLCRYLRQFGFFGRI